MKAGQWPKVTVGKADQGPWSLGSPPPPFSRSPQGLWATTTSQPASQGWGQQGPRRTSECCAYGLCEKGLSRPQATGASGDLPPRPLHLARLDSRSGLWFCSHGPSCHPASVSSDGPHSSPFGDRNLLLCLGSHRVQLPSKEGTHFFCHWHIPGLKLLDVFDQLQDAGCLGAPWMSQEGVMEAWP